MALHEAMRPRSGLEPIEPLLDVPRAAHLLGISVKTLRDWIQARRIDYVKVGTRVMISTGDHSAVCNGEHTPRGGLMKVFKRPGSSFYAYKFQYRGKEYY